MKVSINWLKTYIDKPLETMQLDELFTTKSQEVESYQALVNATDLVVGHVKVCERHPDADKLSVCDVDVGSNVLQIICGAPNVKQGQFVIVALPGAELPGGLKIKKSTIRGVESSGMICSLIELGIESKYHYETGIHVIKDSVKAGEDALSALGFKDHVLALDLTPNRGDLLSVLGVAYDVAAMLDLPVEEKTFHVKETSTLNPMDISTDTEDCLSYYGRIIDNLTIKESPSWMKARLIGAGVRPINNVVDITNYVMIELGQPLHAFDFDLLGSEKIVVRNAKKNETFLTLDDKTRSLTEEDIVITNGEKAVALGGVMGGAETEVTEKTTSILLESAVFNNEKIRKTSHRLDLRSESSMRFERGVDPVRTKKALDMATSLFIDYANATVRKGISYFDNTSHSPKPLELSLSKINSVLGSEYSLDYVSDILRRLGFEHTIKQDTYLIEVPSRRFDVLTYQDMIEEIGRISGYDTLPSTLPSTISVGKLTPYQQFKRRIRQSLTGLGLHEVITYALRDADSVYDYTRSNHIKAVSVMHPMTELRETLSLTPINGLLDVVRYNVSRKLDTVHIFEIGKHYQPSKETEVLGIAMQGIYHDYSWQTTPEMNFFTLKGIFEALLKRFSIENVYYEKVSLKNYHPHQTALIKHEDRVIGHIGKIHPEEAKRLDLKDVYVLDVDIEILYELSEPIKRYQPLGKYPSVSRDLAIVCDESILAQHLIDTIKSHTDSRLKQVRIFDYYVGEHIEEGKKSLALRLQFEDPQKTLETKDIDFVIERIVKALKTHHDAVLR